MIPFEKQLQKEAGRIRMKAAERRALKEHLVSFMEYHPMEGAGKVMPVRRAAKQRAYTEERFSYFRFSGVSWYVRGAASVFALILIVGVPVAAERALPGDVLYPVKVRINEEVFSTLSLSPYEKIEWETRRVERRIAEARLLAREGKLTPEVETAISETVRHHTDEAKKGLAELHTQNADDAAVAQVALESALDVQTVVLETDSVLDTAGDGQIRDLAEVVRDAKAGVVADGVSLNASNTPPYERFVARLEQETTRAYELFNSIDLVMSDEERIDIGRRLADIGRQIDRAGRAHDAAENTVAVNLTRGALSDTQKLIAFMTDIDVRTSVTVESLVPKKLTDEERIEALETSITELRAIRGDVVSRIETSDDEGFKEKVISGVVELDVLLGDIEISIDTGFLDDAEAQMVVAGELANDLHMSAGNLPLSDTLPVLPDGDVLKDVLGTTSTESVGTSTSEDTESDQ